MTVTMHKPQIHEVFLAPVLLWHHMVYVGFLAMLQVVVTPRAESLLPLKELAISRCRGLGSGPSLSPGILEGWIIGGRGCGDEPMPYNLRPSAFPEGGMTHFVHKDPAVLPGTNGAPPILRGSPPA